MIVFAHINSAHIWPYYFFYENRKDKDAMIFYSSTIKNSIAILDLCPKLFFPIKIINQLLFFNFSRVNILLVDLILPMNN